MAKENGESQVQSFIDLKRLKGTWPLKRIFYFIDQLTNVDLLFEKKIKTYTGLMALFFVLSFLSIFVVAILGNAMVLLILPVFIGLGIFFLVMMLKYKKKDLTNEFRAFVQPLLHQLKDDVKQTATITIDLALDPTEADDYKQSTSDKYSVGQYYKCYDHIYERDFLHLQIPLHDGNKLNINGHEFLIKSIKTKRNPRGKIKTKTKYKKKVTFIMGLRVDGTRFQFKQIPSEKGPNKQSITVKNRPTGKEIRLSYQTKLKEELVPDWRQTVSNLMTLYSYLEPVKRSG